MIDTHCHLTDPRLGGQLAGVLQRARAAGVDQLLTIGTSAADSRAAADLAAAHAGVYAVVGIHPNYADEAAFEDVDHIAPLLARREVVAVGECGLDYHHDRVAPARQRAFFERQLELARKHRKPVVFHVREAVDDALAVLAGFPDVRGVFHCFTGTLAECRRIVERGYWVGFTGPVTYKKNDELRACAVAVPGDRILVETDAPYLSPEPVRGQRTCEPAFVMHTARHVAEARGVTVEELDELTTGNARALFQLPM